MAVNQDSKLTAETKSDENDGGARPVSLALGLRRMFPRLENCRSYGREMGCRQWMLAIYDAFR